MGLGVNKQFSRWKQPHDGGALPLLQREVPEAAVQAAAIFRALGSPVWYGGQVQWLPTGQDVFTAMLEDIRRASGSIWLEYDRLLPGVMWDTILMALRQRAAKGIEVRLIYNRCIGNTPRELARMHIQACPLHFPLRTHRQMAIIDHTIAYTGGVGISDGQIGVNHRMKPQRDGAIRMEGCAVREFSAAFAALWESVSGQALPLPPLRQWEDSSYVYMQPFWEASPFSVTKNAMLRMIARAQSELWLMLPSLDAALRRALLQAAQSGVQVHLLLSGKGFGLSSTGIKVYSFPSGTFHARVCCADEQLALLDTGKRGFVPHLGSALWLYGRDAVTPIPAAFRRTLREKKLPPT